MVTPSMDQQTEHHNSVLCSTDVIHVVPCLPQIVVCPCYLLSGLHQFLEGLKSYCLAALCLILFALSHHQTQLSLVTTFHQYTLDQVQPNQNAVTPESDYTNFYLPMNTDVISLSMFYQCFKRGLPLTC